MKRITTIVILLIAFGFIAEAQVPDTLGRTFTTEPAPLPGEVVLVAPADGFNLLQSDEVEHGSITLEWEPAENAAEYELWVSRDGQDYLREVFTDETSYQLEIPIALHEYRWTVRGVNQYGAGDWSGEE